MGKNKNHPKELEAYVKMMSSHQERLRAFIYSIHPNSQDIEDILQNTNAVLWQKSNQFKSGTNFLAWAFKIARYQVMHQRGRSIRDSRLVFSDELIDRIADTNQLDQSHEIRMSALEGCISKLTKKQRDLINERYMAGHSLENYAASIGRSSGSLRIALHRIRESLKRCVENTLGEERT